jgi:large subunit ribosomal protein L22
MTNYTYSFQKYNPKNMAKVIGTTLPISHKVSREIARSIKDKQIDKAMDFLQQVTEKKQAVPYKRYNRDVPHRPGKIAAGRYPIKASQHIIKLLESLKSNAQNKGLDTTKLIIVHAAAQKGEKRMHGGRTRGERKMTHFELVGEEKEIKEKKTKKQKKQNKEGKPK